MTVKEKLKIALHLFTVFFRIGLFSFGGGYAMFTMIEREVVEKHKYLTHDELMDVFAIAESTPGAVAVNTATFVGTKTAGMLGGIIATFGLMLPSLIIIMALSYAIDAVRDNPWVGYLFKGVRAGVLVLIAKAVISFYRSMRKDWFDFVLLIASFLIAFLTEVSVIYIILGTIVLCITFMAITNAVNKKKKGGNAENTEDTNTDDTDANSEADNTNDNSEADESNTDGTTSEADEENPDNGKELGDSPETDVLNDCVNNSAAPVEDESADEKDCSNVDTTDNAQKEENA